MVVAMVAVLVDRWDGRKVDQMVLMSVEWMEFSLECALVGQKVVQMVGYWDF